MTLDWRTMLRRKTAHVVLFLVLIFSIAGGLAGLAQSPSEQIPIDINADLAPAIKQAAFVPAPLIPEGMRYDDVIRHPSNYWKAWISQRLPFHRVLFFLLVCLTPVHFILRTILGKAQSYYEQKWLRSLGIGLLTSAICFLAAGVMVRMGEYVPLAILLLGLIQFLGVCGLVVAANSIGEFILKPAGLDIRIQRQWLRELLILWTGSFALALLVLIPNFWIFQHIGNRMFAWIAAAGAGAAVAAMRRERGLN